MPAQGRSRGRIVMLVDNGVVNDSRVQKQAASIADLGWNVTLLGLHRSKESRWRLGGAQVRLVPTERRNRAVVRSLRWRDPLAHASLAIARYQEVERRGRLIDRQSHRAASGKASLLSRLAGVSLRVRADLAKLRLDRTERAAEGRRTHEGRGDRAVAAALRAASGDRAWRWLDPSLLDLELAFGPELDRIKPDLIHANDFRTLGVAVRAKWRAAAAGRDVKVVWDVHEYLPGLHPWHADARWHEAQLAHEREYAPYADAVVTVSEELAEMLARDHGLATAPTVVMNCPVLSSFDREPTGRDLRADCGVTADVPLMVYSGSARDARGLDVMVEALPALPGVVCALVVSDPQSEYVESLRSRARELGVVDRFKAVPYVPADEVVGYLSGATLGVIPIRHFVNHEIALITKFFEYAHAQLPIVVSDVRAMAAEVEHTGIGEVFVADDVDAFVAAVAKVAAGTDGYRNVYTETELLAAWTWQEQATKLAGVYEHLLYRRTNESV